VQGSLLVASSRHDAIQHHGGNYWATMVVCSDGRTSSVSGIVDRYGIGHGNNWKEVPMSFELIPDNKKAITWRESHFSWPGILAVVDSIGVLDPGEVHQMKYNDHFHVDASACEKIGQRLLKLLDENKLQGVLDELKIEAYSDGAVDSLVSFMAGQGCDVHPLSPVERPTVRHVKLFAAWCIGCGGFRVD
jgi:hypothetical protein